MCYVIFWCLMVVHFREDLHDGLVLGGVEIHQLSRVDFFTIQAGCAVPRVRQLVLACFTLGRTAAWQRERLFARCFSGVKAPEKDGQIMTAWLKVLRAQLVNDMWRFVYKKRKEEDHWPFSMLDSPNPEVRFLINGFTIASSCGVLQTFFLVVGEIEYW